MTEAILLEKSSRGWVVRLSQLCYGEYTELIDGHEVTYKRPYYKNIKTITVTRDKDFVVGNMRIPMFRFNPSLEDRKFVDLIMNIVEEN